MKPDLNKCTLLRVTGVESTKTGLTELVVGAALGSLADASPYNYADGLASELSGT